LAWGYFSPSPYFCSCLELSGIDLLNLVGLVHLLKWWLGYEFGTSLALFFFPFKVGCIIPWILHKPMAHVFNVPYGLGWLIGDIFAH
jgi:hypothetical protein